MMNVSILYIKNAGDIENERVVLKVSKDCDIGNFFTFFSCYQGDTINPTAIISPFWFKDMPVKEGDIIVVYTKSGIFSSKEIIMVRIHISFIEIIKRLFVKIIILVQSY